MSIKNGTGDFNKFVASIIEEEIETYAYSEYLQIVEGVLNNTLVEFELPKRLKKIADFVHKIVHVTGKFLKDGATDVLKFIQDKVVFKFFKFFKFSFSAIHTFVKDGYGLLLRLEVEFTHFIANTGAKDLSKFDEWLEARGFSKKVLGLGVAGLLAYIWFNMAFTGDIEYDMNMSDILNALIGKFNLEDLFAGANGVKLFALLSAGLSGVSFPWPGGATNQFVASVTVALMSITGRVVKNQVKKKMFKV